MLAGTDTVIATAAKAPVLHADSLIPWLTRGRGQLRTRRSAIVLVGLLVSVTARTPASAAGRAGPDPTFGGGRGWVTTRIPGASSVAYGVAMIQAGKIVIVGQASTPAGDGQILVAQWRDPARWLERKPERPTDGRGPLDWRRLLSARMNLRGALDPSYGKRETAARSPRVCATTATRPAERRPATRAT